VHIYGSYRKNKSVLSLTTLYSRAIGGLGESTGSGSPGGP